jgi:hypothetical protein
VEAVGLGAQSLTGVTGEILHSEEALARGSGALAQVGMLLVVAMSAGSQLCNQGQSHC